jgi:hypothetical protein
MLPAGNIPVLNDNQSTKKSQPLTINNNYSVPQNVQLIPSTSYQQQSQQQHHQTPYIRRMSSASEEELETGTVKVNEWQQVKNNKRRKINPSQAYIQNTDITISNRFNTLPQEESASRTISKNRTPKPPHIFIYGVLNYNEMVNKLTETIEQEQYSTKIMADNII